MSGITGIELGPDSCVLVRARQHGDALELSAAHVIDPPAWPSGDAGAAELLGQLRRDKHFPARARVVSWSVVGSGSPADAAADPALNPLIAAGFTIAAVVSPQQALTALAARRPRGNSAAAWLAINRKGAAIAIVRGAEALYSRAFTWDWESAAIGSQAQLLQRYSIVAHLAPEVRRGIESVRAKYGIPVESVVTCGDLPDLRSLTMPLIEELDREVETLDSADGLVIPRRDQLPEPLSRLRLAAAAAAEDAGQRTVGSALRLARAAAIVAVAAGLLWAGYLLWRRPERPAIIATGTPPAAPARTPVATTAPKPPSTQQPGPTNTPTRTTGVTEATPSPADTRESGAARSPQRPSAASALPQPRPSAARPKASAGTGTAPARPAPSAGGARSGPLNDPLPVIDTILVSSDRRIAVVDGAIVGVGDTLGRRTIVRIEPDAVYLKEPSGIEIRVAIRVRR